MLLCIVITHATCYGSRTYIHVMVVSMYEQPVVAEPTFVHTETKRRRSEDEGLIHRYLYPL